MGGAAHLIDVRPIAGEDRAWADARAVERWDGVVARRGELIELDGLAGFVAYLDGERAGLLTYVVRGDAFEVVTLESMLEGRGAGRALLDAARAAAEQAGCCRLWLITTNDNVRALGFYQRWGMDLVALRHGAVDELRRTVKPSIPERDEHGVPIAHELELELRLC